MANGHSVWGIIFVLVGTIFPRIFKWFYARFPRKRLFYYIQATKKGSDLEIF